MVCVSNRIVKLGNNSQKQTKVYVVVKLCRNYFTRKLHYNLLYLTINWLNREIP